MRPVKLTIRLARARGYSAHKITDRVTGWQAGGLLDDLRDRIWTHYELALVNKLREERVSYNDPTNTDPPF